MNWTQEEALWPPGSGALAAMRVIDLSQQLPGPYATSLLVALGASVIKVEPPDGDLARVIDPAMYQKVNRGKRIVELDLKTRSAQRTLQALAREADVVFESYRPGVMKRLGGDPETLSQINPRLIYCSISGFGQYGPLAGRPAHDLNVQAILGAVSPNDVHQNVGVAWVDLGTGVTAALAVTAAWHAGQSGYLDLGMVDIAAHWTAVKPGALTEIEPLYGVVQSGDGVPFAIAVLEDKVWLRACDAFGWTDWHAAARFATAASRRLNNTLIRDRLEKAIGDMPAAEIDQFAKKHDLPITIMDAADPDVREQLEMRRNGPFGAGIAAPAAWDRSVSSTDNNQKVESTPPSKGTQ